MVVVFLGRLGRTAGMGTATRARASRSCVTRSRVGWWRSTCPAGDANPTGTLTSEGRCAAPRAAPRPPGGSHPSQPRNRSRSHEAHTSRARPATTTDFRSLRDRTLGRPSGRIPRPSNCAAAPPEADGRRPDKRGAVLRRPRTSIRGPLMNQRRAPAHYERSSCESTSPASIRQAR